MDNQVHNQIVSFIWGIADDCLRDIYVRGKYRDVILPMTVIRRLDALLEDTKPAVLEMKEKLDAADIDNQWPALCNAAGQAFCNASPFLLKDLTSRAKKQTLKADFEAYLDGFSPNVKEILEKFKFRNQIDTMIEADILGAVIEKFVSSDINLSPNPIYKDEEKTILKHPGLDNHGMGTIFEELIRRFNEENNEEAGEHWTPRDVVELMADLTLIGSEGLAVSGRGNNAWNAYVAALNILNAKILFSKSNLLVSKLFEPGTDGKRKSLEKHHLFPKAYLKTLGYNDAKINQMANYAFIDWKDNMEILDEAPAIYYPVVCEGRSPEEIQKMEEENALPHGWENMSYEDFLIERRKLMATKIKQAFEILKNNAN